MALSTVHYCPRCELRFASRAELEDHIGLDHTPMAEEDLPPVVGVSGTVLVAVDPAQPPGLAVPLATALAAQADMTLEVVAAPSPGLVTEPFVDARVQEAAGAGAPRARGRVLPGNEDGDAAAAILDELAQRDDVTMVCMTTHARGTLGQFLLGSVSTSVVERSPRPVLMVGPAVRRVGRPIRRVVVGLDGSEVGEGALPVADDLARSLGAELHLVAVTPDGDDRARRPQYLQEAASRHGVHPESTTAVAGHDPARAIAEVAGDRADTLTVVGTGGPARAAETAMGSVGATLVRHSTVPVLLVPPAAQRP
jgi:nucleotide-binding universal stress UspA family protein